MNERKYSFELFGYDFMIDNDGTVWLIEVNTNPCIEESSPILQKLIPRMIGILFCFFLMPDDAFKLTIDVLFPKPQKKDEDDPNKIKSPSKKEESSESEESDSDEGTIAPPTKNGFMVPGYNDEENMW